MEGVKCYGVDRKGQGRVLSGMICPVEVLKREKKSGILVIYEIKGFHELNFHY